MSDSEKTYYFRQFFSLLLFALETIVEIGMDDTPWPDRGGANIPGTLANPAPCEQENPEGPSPGHTTCNG